jgi:hypothetical protein
MLQSTMSASWRAKGLATAGASGGLMGQATMLTVFTSPKPFVGHIDTIQRNALASWAALGEGVEILVVGDEAGAAEAAAEVGGRYLPQVERNTLGTPLLSSIFAVAHQASSRPILCYVNADILLLEDLLSAVRRANGRFGRFLMVGRRWDLEVRERLRFDGEGLVGLRRRIEVEGSLHPPTGSDYFVFPRSMFQRIPPFALGRAGWDNWMIFAGRRAHVPVIDATEAVTVVHQRHDYEHLPGGQPHFRLPESRHNVEMVGGRAAVFTMLDTTWRLHPAGLERKPWNAAGTTRSLEAGIYAILGFPSLIRLARLAMHPVETFRYYRSAARRRLGRLLGKTRSDPARR